MALLPARNNPNAKFDELYESAKRARMPFEREAWLNLAFFLNQMYVEWYQENPKLDPVFREIPRTDSERDRPRPLVNKIMHYTRQSQASVLQDEPQGDVLPATDDIMDQGWAELAKAYIDEQADPTNMNYSMRLRRAALWALIAGTSWLKWTWNPILGRNDVCPVSFFDAYVDPFATEWNKARYMIQTQFMDVEQVYDMFGVEVKPDAVQKTDSLKSQLMQQMGSAPVLSGVTVKELWHLPSRRHPSGLYVVWAGREQFVMNDRLPYDVCVEERKLPYTMLGCIERPDSVYHMSPISYLRSAQMLLNQYHAQRTMLRQKFANAKWLIPEEIQLQNDPNDSAAQILRYKASGGLKPEIAQPQTYIPNDDGEMIETQMMHIVGQHEVSQAQVPGRVEAAKAIQMLLDQDANALSTLREWIKVANSQGWYFALSYAKQFEKPEVMVSAYGSEGLPEVKAFKAAKLKPGVRIKTTMTTGLASSRAARQDQLARLWDAGVITDREVMAELMDIPLPSLVGDKAADAKRARNENLIMAAGPKGTPIEARSWDDHDIHLAKHNAFRKTNDFELLSPEAKTVFERHCQGHESLRQQKAEQDAQLAQMQLMILQGKQAMDQAQGDGGPPVKQALSDNSDASATAGANADAMSG